MAIPGNPHFEKPTWTIEQFDRARFALTILATVAGVAIGGAAGLAAFVAVGGISWLIMGPLGGLALGGIAGGLVGSLSFAIYLVFFLMDSFLKADPERVEKFLPIMLGRFVNRLLGPGFIYFPLFTICKLFQLMGYEAIDGQEFNLRFTVVQRLPGDKLEVKYTVYFYLTVYDNDPAKLIAIQGIPGAFRRVIEQTAQYIQEFITSPLIGPQKYDQARAMAPEAVNFVLEKFEFEDFRALSRRFPSHALIGFARDRTVLSPFEEERKKEFDALDEADKADLMRKANERLALLEQVRNGDRPLVLHHLGLWMVKMGIDEIDAVGSSKKFLENVANAEQKAVILDIDVNALGKGIATLLKAAPGMSAKEAAENVQVQQKDFPKEVKIVRHELGDNIVDGGAKLLDKIITFVMSKSLGSAGKE